MDEQHEVNLLRIANSIDNDNDNNLPALEHRYESLKQQVNSLETRKLNSNQDLQDKKANIIFKEKFRLLCLDL
jgi:hypothetical protein